MTSSVTLDSLIGDIPGIGAPAARALAEQNLLHVRSVADADWNTLKTLHGVGPKAGVRLQEVLVANGRTLLNPPVPKERTATYTSGATGKQSKDIKTHKTSVSPEQFVDSLDARRCAEGHQLLELFSSVTGEAGTMWGPSMIGYGEMHYVYATGREGDTFHVGFSPRKANIALYGLQHHPRSDDLLSRLGPHKTGAACVWVTSLAKVDSEVLRELVEHAWAQEPGACAGD